MPWLETAPMDQRLQFITDHRRGFYSMTDLRARYEISRKTGYQCLDRFEQHGRAGLAPRSRAPHSCPHRIAADLAELLCATRRKHPDWGAGKLLDYLEPRHPPIDWPAVSTVNDLLARHGLVPKRRRRPPPQHPGVVPRQPTPPIAVTGFPRRGGAGPRAVFERMFRAYGLPRAIRTDNGVPFATTSLHGLSQLNVWWMRLGIVHQRIQPARPQQNGVHERMKRARMTRSKARRRPRAISPRRDRCPRASPAGVPGALSREKDHDRRDGPIPAPAALPRQSPGRAPRRPGRDGRWHLVDLLQHGPAGQAGRARLHPAWLTQKVLPIS